MKNLFFLLLIVSISSCNSEGGLDCFKKWGELVTEHINTEDFNQIRISTGIELIVKQAEEYDIRVETGKNFIDQLKFEVENGELKISDESNCSMLRDYHPAKVYISTPVLERIYSGSQYAIKSDGVLKFPELTLETRYSTESQPPGFFDIEVDNEKLRISDDASSIFKIKGKSKDFDIKVWNGGGRIEAGELIATNISFYYRSSNDLIVFPENRIKGTLAGTGNLVLKNVPPIVEVEQLYSGHIVYP